MLRAYYYTALVEDQEYSSIRPLIDWLDYNGYKVVTKPAKEYLTLPLTDAEDADHFIDLATLNAEVGRDPSERPPRRTEPLEHHDDDL